jgi:hypothetical protein
VRAARWSSRLFRRGEPLSSDTTGRSPDICDGFGEQWRGLSSTAEAGPGASIGVLSIRDSRTPRICNRNRRRAPPESTL